MEAYTYILLCSDDSYYIGATRNLERRLKQHQSGEGASFTKHRLPVRLLYYEKHSHIDAAFKREKQIKGWTRRKKEALINSWTEELKKAAECKNDSHSKNKT